MFQNLRQQPDSVKKKIALGIAGFVTCIIAIVWIISTLPDATKTVVQTKTSGFAFLDKLEENVGTLFANVGGQISKIKTQFHQIQEYKNGTMPANTVSATSSNITKPQ
jgi:hypothetical protein